MSAQPLRTPPAQLRRTRCNCHPETCCCGEYTFYLNGERIVSGYRDNLQKVADAVNAAAALSQQPEPKPEARGVVDDLRRAVAAIGVVGDYLGKDTILRESVLDLIDRRVAALTEARNVR